MKHILPILILLITVSSSMAIQWPWQKKQPVPQPTPVVVVTKSKNPIQDSRLIVKELSVELNNAKAENTRLKTSLVKATDNVKQAEFKVAEVQKAADALKEWGMIQQAEAQKFMEKYNAAVKRYHRLKLIAAFIAAAGGVLLGLQFMNLVPPPYNMGVPVGGAILFAALVWFLL
jgi:hypothetical protein